MTTETEVSSRSIWNRLHNSFLCARPYFGAVLFPQHARNRLNWTNLHRRWIQRQWNNVASQTSPAFAWILLMVSYECGLWRVNVMIRGTCCRETATVVEILWFGVYIEEWKVWPRHYTVGIEFCPLLRWTFSSYSSVTFDFDPFDVISGFSVNFCSLFIFKSYVMIAIILEIIISKNEMLSNHINCNKI